MSEIEIKTIPGTDSDLTTAPISCRKDLMGRVTPVILAEGDNQKAGVIMKTTPKAATQFRGIGPTDCGSKDENRLFIYEVDFRHANH